MIPQNTSQNANFSIKNNDGIVFLAFTNNKILNESTIVQISNDINELIDGVQKVKLCINFKYVKYLSSSVLSRLVSIQKKVSSLNGKLVLCSIDPILMKIFEITQLHKFFKIADNENSAKNLLK